MHVGRGAWHAYGEGRTVRRRLGPRRMALLGCGMYGTLMGRYAACDTDGVMGAAWDTSVEGFIAC